MPQNNPKQEAELRVELAKIIGTSFSIRSAIPELERFTQAHTTKLLNEQLTRLEEQRQLCNDCVHDNDELETVQFIPLTAIEKEREKLK